MILGRGLASSSFTALALAGTLAVGGVAHAEPTEADRTSARSLASEGYDALERKDYATAVDRFRHADSLVHAPTIGVDLARALIGLGRYVEAYERYELIIREGVPKGSPSSWKQAVDDAQRESADLEPRLAWIVIHVMGPLDPQVTIDGDDVPEGAIGARRAADPGKRTVRAIADGFEPASQTVTLREGQEQVVTLVLERSASPHPLSPATSDRSRANEKPLHVSRTPAWVAFGVGGAGVVLGTVTGVLALNIHSTLQRECPTGTCHPADDAETHRDTSDLNRYHTLGTLAGVGFGLGVGGAATGLVLLLTDAATEHASQRATLWPVVGPSEIGMAGRF
ncbi:MAG TPA: hypothetical protein VMI54_16340 [Polyangiaceae bacterium]|nr:hypothetical protein [Polyangiaceae bacterium]